jgi:TetR/AcrR family transcriptional repressor of mexJK operon
MPSAPRSQRPSSERKRRQIMEVAIAMFLTQGYRDTSVEQIAAAASVSKTTVYKNFAGKESLLREAMLGTLEEFGAEMNTRAASLAEAIDLAGELRVFARAELSTLMLPEILQRRRIVVAEANRLPDFALEYYERTYGLALDVLAASFRALVRRGLLRDCDGAIAAEQFLWLLIGAPRNRVMLCGDSVTFSQDELSRHADIAVTTFLTAYGTAP